MGKSTVSYIGDNVNFRVGKTFQRSNEKENQQYQWFASCAIIQNCEFSQYCENKQHHSS